MIFYINITKVPEKWSRMTSDRVSKWVHYLNVLSSARTDLYHCIIETCDKDLLICVAEIFVNIGNLTISLDDKDIAFLRGNLKKVEALGSIVRGGQRAARDTLIRNRSVVQRGVAAALSALQG